MLRTISLLARRNTYFNQEFRVPSISRLFNKSAIATALHISETRIDKIELSPTGRYAIHFNNFGDIKESLDDQIIAINIDAHFFGTTLLFYKCDVPAFEKFVKEENKAPSALEEASSLSKTI